MQFIFLFGRVYPYFAIALCVPLMQLAKFYRNRGSKIQWAFVILAAASLGSAVAWGIFRGDQRSDEWVKSRLMIDALPQQAPQQE